MSTSGSKNKQHRKVREDPMFRTRVVNSKKKSRNKRDDIADRLSEFYSTK